MAVVICYTSIVEKDYGNFFTSWVTILEAFAVMFGCYMAFLCYEDARLKTPHKQVLLVLLSISEGMFYGGACSHSYITTVLLTGIAVATCTLTAAAIFVYMTGKSKRLKRTVNIFVLIGFACYVGIFVLLWNLLGSEHTLTFRQFFVIAWCIAYLPFAYYLAYATVLFVVPELEDPDDFIMASIELKLYFAPNFMRVLWHWRQIYRD